MGIGWICRKITFGRFNTGFGGYPKEVPSFSVQQVLCLPEPSGTVFLMDSHLGHDVDNMSHNLFDVQTGSEAPMSISHHLYPVITLNLAFML